MAVSKHEAAQLLDQLIGVDAALTHLMRIAQRLQQEPDGQMKTIASTSSRHARGAQVAIAVAKQRLQQISR